MPITRSLLSALSPRRVHVRRGAAVAMLGCVAAFGLQSSPTLADVVTTTIPVGSWPEGIALNPAYDTIYVADVTGNAVWVINGATDTVTATVSVGQVPWGAAFDPVTGSVYVSNAGGNTVSVIDAAIDEVSATVTVGSMPEGIAVDPATNTIYVANGGTGTVSVIDGYTNQVTATVAVGSGPDGEAVDPDTNMIYVANYGSGTVSVIDGYTNQVTATVPVGEGPAGIAVDPVTELVYAANYSGNTVSVIDEATNAVTDALPVGSDPIGVAVDPATFTVYVANISSNTVSVINEATDAVTGAVPVGQGPNWLAFDPDTGFAYVSNQDSNSVSVINTQASPPGSQTIAFNTKPPANPAFGSTYTVSATGGGSGNPVTFTIDASDTSVCSISGSTVTFNNAGSCIIDANQVGNATYQAAHQAQQAITVPKETPVLTWHSPGHIYYGTALSGAQLDATASAPGTFTYSPAAGTVLAIGTRTLTATFTPADTTDYTSGGTVSTYITVVVQVPPCPTCNK